MGKKYRFRKVYFVCYENQVIKPSLRWDTFYKYKDDATKEKESVETDHQAYVLRGTIKQVPTLTVEGFYLVHESLYKELLAAFDKNVLKVVK